MYKLLRALPHSFLSVIFAATALLLAACPPVSAEDERAKGNFHLFDGRWLITDGPLTGLDLQLGQGTRNGVSFVLFSQGAFQSFRTGIWSREKRDTYKGKFAVRVGDDFRVDDPASLAGVGESGIFLFRLDTGYLNKLSGEIINDGGVSVPVKAVLTLATFRNAKFMLNIEPTKRREYKVGEYVPFKVTAILRGPAGVDYLQPILEIAFDSAITDVQLIKMKRFSVCRVLPENYHGISCDFDTLGPISVVATLNFKVKVPEALAGQKLAAAVGILNTTRDGSIVEQFLIDASAVTRTTKVKIKKSSQPTLPGACTYLPGTWVFANGVQMIFQTNRTIDFSFGDFSKSGTWTCVANPNSTTFGIEADYQDGFGDAITLSADGGTLSYFPFGAFKVVTGSKVASP